jgi:putative FmdB family regulatory protein
VPLYEYECKRCHHRFERIQKYSDPLVRKCPKCKVGRVEKLLSAPAVQFKGTGWYVTDYGAKKGEKSGEGGKSESGGKDSGKSESGGKDSGKSSSSSSSSDSSSSSERSKDSGKPASGKGGDGKSSKS